VLIRIAIASLTFVISVGCAVREAHPFWSANSPYQLVLVAAAPRLLTPERERAIAPVSDSAVLQLRVDSIARDSVYGRLTGETPHFWVQFRATGGDRFTAVRTGRRWLIAINAHATDTGLTLLGEEANGHIHGVWEPRVWSRARGVFALGPTT
jgi:hypothetical protein